MNAADRHQLLTIFIGAVTALFVASGMPRISRWARRIRQVAIIGYALALVLVLLDVAIWLFS